MSAFILLLKLRAAQISSPYRFDKPLFQVFFGQALHAQPYGAKLYGMGSDFDASEFVDDDFQTARKAAATPATPSAGAAPAAEPQRAPSREEIEGKIGAMQNQLAELKRAQQDLERERTALEETRRRQVEFTTGRQEMVDQITRGVTLLAEAEFAARRDAEQMAKALANLRDALAKVQAVQEETWSNENLQVELARSNTLVENARMEWNSARLKFPILSGAPANAETPAAPADQGWAALLRQQSFPDLCRLGLAMTWPVAAVGLLILLVLLIRR